MEPVVLPYSTRFMITLGAKYNENSTIVKNYDNVLVTKFGSQISICLTEKTTDDSIFKAMLSVVMLELDVNFDQIEAIVEEMKKKNYSFSVDHLVIEKHRISINQ